MNECKYFNLCGGCIGVKHDYNTLLKQKTEKIRDIFGDNNVNPCIGNYYPFKYRNKLQLAFHEFKGKTLIGFYEENSSRVVDIDGCILNGDYASTIIIILREYISRFKLRAYNPNKTGVLKYAHIRCVDGNLQLTLCVTSYNFGGRDWLYRKLLENFKTVSLYLNLNNRTDNAVFGRDFKHIAGMNILQFEFMGLKIELYPSSFLQVNLSMTEKIYKKCMELLDLTFDTTVLDLYSGISITSLLFAKKCKRVIAIEDVGSAVMNARNMSKNNKIKNITFYTGKCEDLLDKMEKDDNLVLFVDPARMGIDKRVLDRILMLQPRKIIYMSCNPETCVRDIKYLLNDNKYECKSVTPYDMFSFTNHIEVLVELIKR